MNRYEKDNRNRKGNRRDFLKKGIALGSMAGAAGVGILSSCQGKTSEIVSPSEDLMREHGVLNRVMLIYDHCSDLLAGHVEFPAEVLNNAAMVIRDFIEDYHEKLEEDFLFPRFEKANHMIPLVQTLYVQHAAGREITEQVIGITKKSISGESEDGLKLAGLLNDFNTMYRPHEAREDTVIFPELRKIVSAGEFAAMGEDFERKEHEKFGKDGFEAMVERVASLERQLGIFDLSGFTPE